MKKLAFMIAALLVAITFSYQWALGFALVSMLCFFE